MNTGSVRAENIRTLVKKMHADGVKYTSMAEKMGLTASYLYQIRSGGRAVGEKVARKVERSLNLEPLTLDQMNSEIEGRKSADKIDAVRLCKLIDEIKDSLEKSGSPWTDPEVVELALDLYEIWKRSGAMPDVQGATRLVALRNR